MSANKIGLGNRIGTRGRGRPKGSPNKLTRTIKEAIEAAFSAVGGEKYLARMAEQQPVAFMSLLGKVLPTQLDVNGNLALIGMPVVNLSCPDAD
jgi:hypothetical protein